MPAPGDLYAIDSVRVVHIDPATGSRTTVSCWIIGNNCPELIGTGPSYSSTDAFGSHHYAGVSPDGRIITCCGFFETPGQGSAQLGNIAIDPKTGNREVVASSSVGSGQFAVGPMVVWPRFNYFLIGVTALPAWGLLAVAGFLGGFASHRLRSR